MPFDEDPISLTLVRSALDLVFVHAALDESPHRAARQGEHTGSHQAEALGGTSHVALVAWP